MSELSPFISGFVVKFFFCVVVFFHKVSHVPFPKKKKVNSQNMCLAIHKKIHMFIKHEKDASYY